MHATDLNEASHEHDEGNAHQQHCPPMGHDPLCNVFIELRVEDGLLQPGQRPVRIHQAALHEHVTVALEVVARRAGRQRGHFIIKETSQRL